MPRVVPSEVPVQRASAVQAMTPEGKVKAAVKRVLDRPGIWYYMPAQNGFGTKGIPDFLGTVNGEFFAIETKAGKKRPTLLQQLTLDKIAAAGGAAFVINETNLESLTSWIALRLQRHQ